MRYLRFPFYLFKDSRKSNLSGGGGIAGSLMVLLLWCGACAGPLGFLMVSLLPLIMHVSADIQWFQRSLGLNYCSHIWLELYRPNETKSVASRTCYARFGSLPSPASLWSGTSPLGGSRCIWGAVDDSRPVEPFIDPSQCPSCFRRAIIETPLSSQL